MNAFGTSPLVSVGADPHGEPGADINAGPFWPAVSMTKARSSMRIDGSVTEERLREALIEAAITTNEALAEWKIARLAAGVTHISQTGSEQIDDESVNVHRWRRAVHGFAAASLAERYRGTDATGEGLKHVLVVESPIEDLRRDALWAISDIIGQRRSTVELI